MAGGLQFGERVQDSGGEIMKDFKDWILRSFVMLGGLGAIVASFNPRDFGRPALAFLA